MGIDIIALEAVGSMNIAAVKAAAAVANVGVIIPRVLLLLLRLRLLSNVVSVEDDANCFLLLLSPSPGNNTDFDALSSFSNV